MSPGVDDMGREFSERPWGAYLVLDDTQPDHKVKRITVAPGRRLSYQSHTKRSEHWVVISGTAKVTLDGVDHLVSAGHSIDVPVNVKHRCENPGDEPLVIIEVQFGTYFGEDDIHRYEDDFGRAGS